MNQQIKERLVSSAFVIICIVLYFYFPINNSRFEIFVGVISFLFILPILYIKYVLKKDLSYVGFSSFAISMKDSLFVVLSIILGGLASFIVVSYNLGVSEYIDVLSKTILYHFGAFMFYETFFSAIMLFLFTFFTWGFVYSIDFNNHFLKTSFSLMVFIILLTDFYKSLWIVIPFIIPILFIFYIRDKKNILYLFSAIFIINLVLDTLIIKMFS